MGGGGGNLVRTWSVGGQCVGGVGNVLIRIKLVCIMKIIILSVLIHLVFYNQILNYTSVCVIKIILLSVLIHVIFYSHILLKYTNVCYKNN